MRLLGRLIAALLILAALPLHLVAPAVKVLEPFDADLYLMFAGADPLVTAYVDASWWPSVMVAISACLLIAAMVQVIARSGQPSYLVLLATLIDALSLLVAERTGVTPTGLGAGQLMLLGLMMFVVWIAVRLAEPNER